MGDNLLSDLMEIVGTPNNLAGYVVLYCLAGMVFICHIDRQFFKIGYIHSFTPLLRT